MIQVTVDDKQYDVPTLKDAEDITRLSELETKLMMMIMMGNTDELEEKVQEMFAYRVISTRIPEDIKEKIDDKLLLYFGAISTSPGEAVSWAIALSDFATTQDEPLEFSTFWEGRFAMGLPTKEEKLKIWDGQKAHALGIPERDNMYDDESVYEALKERMDSC